MSPVKFDELKNKIEEGIKKRLPPSFYVNETEGYMLIEGFLSPNVLPEIGGAFVLGGPVIPMVGVVGRKTGMVYTFALKAILPDLEIWNQKE